MSKSKSDKGFLTQLVNQQGVEIHYLTEEQHLEIIIVCGVDPSADAGAKWNEWIDGVWGFILARWPNYLHYGTHAEYWAASEGETTNERRDSKVIDEIVDVHVALQKKMEE